MGVTINVQVNPAMSGWRVELWYLYLSEWIFFYDKTTDSNGKVVLKAAASFYPVGLKVIVPAQTMGGIAYGAQERWKSYDNGDVEYLTFNMESVGIPTTITINAPASVEPDEEFYITGTLYETNTGLAIPGHLVNISYNGVSLGNTMTGIDGEYLLQTVIPIAGTFTLTASFAGTATLGASEATSKLRTGGIEIQTLIPLAALTLFAYTIFKR